MMRWVFSQASNDSFSFSMLLQLEIAINWAHTKFENGIFFYFFNMCFLFECFFFSISRSNQIWWCFQLEFTELLRRIFTTQSVVNGWVLRCLTIIGPKTKSSPAQIFYTFWNVTSNKFEIFIFARFTFSPTCGVRYCNR